MVDAVQPGWLRGLHLRSPRVHASVRGQRDGCQHDAGSIRCPMCLSHRRARPRSATVLTTASIGTASPWGPRRPALRQASTAAFDLANGGQADMAAGGTSDWNTVPSLHIRCRIDPIRRASATIARFAPLRFATCAAQLLSHDERPRFIMTVAAWQSALRRFASPARVMPPDTSRSPDWFRDGVRPTQGPTFFDDENRVGSSTADRKVKPTTAPIPGIVIRRRQMESSCAISRTCRSSPASSWRKLARARSMGAVAASSMALPSTSSRMRTSKRPREIAPTFRPKFLSSLAATAPARSSLAGSPCERPGGRGLPAPRWIYSAPGGTIRDEAGGQSPRRHGDPS